MFNETERLWLIVPNHFMRRLKQRGIIPFHWTRSDIVNFILPKIKQTNVNTKRAKDGFIKVYINNFVIVLNPKYVDAFGNRIIQPVTSYWDRKLIG